MRGRRVLVTACVLWLSSVSSLAAQEIRYLGKEPGLEKGYIAWRAGQPYEVGKGTVISGWVVTEITESHLVLERALSEAEQETLRREGRTVYHAIQIKIPHDDLRVIPVPAR